MQIFSKLLEREGYTTESVYLGNEDLELLFKKHYDFIIEDYNLPDISGMDILQCIDRSLLLYANQKMNRLFVNMYKKELIIMCSNIMNWTLNTT